MLAALPDNGSVLVDVNDHALCCSLVFSGAREVCMRVRGEWA
jgi:hypothetical protein